MKRGPKGKRRLNMNNCSCCCCEADRRNQREKLERPSVRRLEADAIEQMREAALSGEAHL